MAKGYYRRTAKHKKIVLKNSRYWVSPFVVPKDKIVPDIRFNEIPHNLGKPRERI